MKRQVSIKSDFPVCCALVGISWLLAIAMVVCVCVHAREGALERERERKKMATESRE